MARYQHESSTLKTILLHPALLFFTAVLIIIVGALSLWQNYQAKIVTAEQFRLTPETLQLTQTPDWAAVDLRHAIFSRDPAQSTLDTELVPKTAAYLESLGWIEKINRIQKTSNGLNVDINYRTPVAMVKLSNSQLLPIDRYGVVLASEYIRPEKQSNLMQVFMFRPLQKNESVHHWQTWPDQRVLEAAAIGYVLEDFWQSQGLFRVVTMQLPGNNAHTEPFELWTRGHVDLESDDRTPYASKVIWGNAPGLESQNEALAHLKIKAIQDFISTRGPLATAVPKGKWLDVRTGKAVLTTRVRSAQQVKFSSSIR